MAKRGVQVQHEKTSPAGTLAHRPTVIQRKNPLRWPQIKGKKGADERLKRDVEANKKQAQEGIEESTSNV